MSIYFNLKVGSERVNGVVLQYDGTLLIDRTRIYDIKCMEDERGNKIYDLNASGKKSVRVAIRPGGLLEIIECSKETYLSVISKEEADKKVDESENWRLLQGWVSTDLPAPCALDPSYLNRF